MTTWTGPEFGLIQIVSWTIIIGIWLAIVYFAWKFFLENPMATTGKERRKLDSQRLAALASEDNEHEKDSDKPARDRSA
ncbi:MAG: hypothetical protein HOP22_14900 [Nitrospiraceae bacterium]|jgi:hypothetical protein|nr:hypothetical protein [Nitrospiraceae bacterium]